MTYKSTLAYLYNRLPMFHRIGAAAYKADLSTTIRIAALLGNPQQKFPSVHVAGTNGKGSVSHFLSSVLQEAGCKTGLFTSPHLRDFRERIRVDGKMIPKSDVIHFVKIYRNDFEQLQPSFFEWTFALASWYFEKTGIDVAVMETGMGGRLDSTNIIRPVVSVITNIGYDHTQFLGNTLQAIAGEKAGIIKPGVPVVIGETQPETAEVFAAAARKNGSSITFADKQFSLQEYAFTKSAQRRLKAVFASENPKQEIRLISPLSGKYQLKNLQTVLASVAELKKAGYEIANSHVRAGVRRVVVNTGLKGRWQTLCRKPLIIADIGHNADGIRQVVDNISLTPHGKLHVVLGVVNDKDVTGMLSLLPKQAEYYFCKADIPRGLDANELAKKAAECGLQGKVYPSVKTALQSAQHAAANDDLVVVTGSAFVVAEAV